ncbi:hypothetical protein D1007_43468 [Hordeum vulgare]|nr:hypothetical protein D1007_43468 [Hordeum vulgare]
MGADVCRLLQQGIPVLEQGDGVPAVAAISDGLEVGRIGITLEDPLLGASHPSISLLIRVDDRQLVLKIVSQKPFVGTQTRAIGPKVEKLNGC